LSSHIAVVNSDGYIVAVNEAWRRFAIQNGDEKLQHTCVGVNYLEVCSMSASHGEPMGEAALQGIKSVLFENSPSFYTEYPCHSPGSERWFGMSIRKFDKGDDMVVIAHEDITERKLADIRLVQKNQELEKTNHELDKFAYSTSHDLRSPLSTILGLVGLMERESKEKSTLEYVNFIRVSVVRLDELLKNILGYSRNNRAMVEPKTVPVRETIDSCIEALRKMPAAESIDFRIDVDEQTPFISDAERLYSIVENLVSNSIKFNDVGKAERYVSIVTRTDKHFMTLQIEDNGIGIPDQYLSRVFEMFFRLPNRSAGSGIGLYIVKETVSKMEGTIKVQSKEGVGTTFTVTLKNFDPTC
jgi:signal transduction histidine kinase